METSRGGRAQLDAGDVEAWVAVLQERHERALAVARDAAREEKEYEPYRAIARVFGWMADMTERQREKLYERAQRYGSKDNGDF